MIRVEQLKIREFRGIRNLTLSPYGANFAICGPNGTGKSGIVDAVEFALTGEISRLSGKGTGGLSVKAHGPHVDSRNKPGEAFVEASLSIAHLNKQASISRTVKEARNPRINSEDKLVVAALSDVALHPEFVLSRRELIRYVLSEPGKRSEEVQVLLRLDELDGIRATLQKIANASDKEVVSAKRIKDQSHDDLLRVLGIPKLATQDLLTAVNSRRALLDLPHLEILESDTSILDGLAVLAGSPASSGRLIKSNIQADLQAAKDAFSFFAEDEMLAAIQRADELIKELEAHPDSANLAAREELLQSAISLFDEDRCPVCDTEWKPTAFREHVAKKREQLAGATAQRKDLEANLVPVTARLDNAIAAISLAAKHGQHFNPPIAVNEIVERGQRISAITRGLKKLFPLDKSRELLAMISAVSSDGDIFATLDAAANLLADPSERDSARDYLVRGQEKLENYRKNRLAEKIATARAETSRKVFEAFGKSVTEELNAIYKAVEQRFVSLYRIVNREDEGDFDAHLAPSLGKLGFDVDFYGRGFFPPGAYHSEGHQDGMGLCLYLALMDHLLGKNFTFAVLDDVLMSVDAGHRREVCRMLKQEFSHTQFLLTTHDEIWLRHMKTEGLIAPGACANFRKWDVELGPSEWDDRDVWQEIDLLLEKGDVRGTAALLRHFLEHSGQEACHQLRARVEFRGDAQFTLNDTLPNALKTLSDLYKLGRSAAVSWKQSEIAESILAREAPLNAAKAATRIDDWQLNAAVHYNAWAALSKEDFVPLVAAYRELFTHLSCGTCSGSLYVSPERGEKEAVRCNCGAVNINLLRQQPKSQAADRPGLFPAL